MLKNVWQSCHLALGREAKSAVGDRQDPALANERSAASGRIAVPVLLMDMRTIVSEMNALKHFHFSLTQTALFIATKFM